MAMRLVVRVVDTMVARARKVLSVLKGLASKQSRIDSAGRLLAYSLNSLPLAVMKRHLEYAPRLPDEALSGATLHADREALLSLLPKGGIVAEVGVLRGEFSGVIARTCQPDKFHLIDIDLSPLGAVPMPVETHEGDSSTILASFEPGYFDWLYIDGDHSYDAVSKDLRAAHRALKSGGFLMCNDYSNWCSAAAVPYGVARAVNELVITERYQVRGLGLHAAGLHDILIQKP